MGGWVCGMTQGSTRSQLSAEVVLNPFSIFSLLAFFSFYFLRVKEVGWKDGRGQRRE